jgi:hypothetical protein
VNQTPSSGLLSPLGRILLTTVALVALVAACGGGKKDNGNAGDTGPITEKQATDVAQKYFLATFGVLTGKSTPQQLIDLYAPECRQNVKAENIAATMLLARAFLPQLAEVDIEDVDLGELKFETNDQGVLVTAVDPNSARVKVNGKFVGARDYFQSLGLSDEGDSTDTTNEPIQLVRRDGKVLIGDCSGLSDYASSSTTGSSGIFGSPVQATGPGSSREDAIKLGDSAVVEDTWRLTVINVNKDAWNAVKNENSFNDPPSANERVVLVRLSAENVSSDNTPQHIGDFEVSLTGSHNELYSSYDQDHGCFAPDELDAQLYPKGKTQGNVCFRIPADETGLLLVWDSFTGGQVYFKLD